MKIIREVLYCGLLIVLIAIGVRSLIFIDHLDKTVTAVPALVDARVASLQQAVLTRVDVAESGVLREVTDARRDITKQITGIRGDLTGTILQTFDARLESIQKDANSQLTTTNAQFEAVLKPLAETGQQIDDAAPLFLDCQYNPDCIFNRYQGTMKSVERTMQVVAAEAPKITVSVDKIAASSAGVADSADKTGKEVVKAAQRFNAPQTFWQAFRTWSLTIARIMSYF